MTSQESFYTSTPAPTSPYSRGPPPPPPKPTSHKPSTDPSRTRTPSQSSAGPTGPPVPPPPPHEQQPYQAPSQNPALNPSSPRPPPPIPQPNTPQSPTHPQTQQSQKRPQHEQAINQLVAAPSIEEHWLPADLASKPITDLTAILSNQQLLSALASQHLSHASSLEPLQSAIAANMALAQQVSTVEAQLGRLRDQTAQLLLNHTSLQTQWRRKQSEMDDALSPWGPRAMYQRLVSSINEQESLLRAVQESFLDGAGDGDAYGGRGSGKASDKEVTDWVKRIREGTTTLERRREMRARWDEGRVGGWR